MATPATALPSPNLSPEESRAESPLLIDNDNASLFPITRNGNRRIIHTSHRVLSEYESGWYFSKPVRALIWLYCLPSKLVIEAGSSILLIGNMTLYLGGVLTNNNQLEELQSFTQSVFILQIVTVGFDLYITFMSRYQKLWGSFSHQGLTKNFNKFVESYKKITTSKQKMAFYALALPGFFYYFLCLPVRSFVSASRVLSSVFGAKDGALFWLSCVFTGGVSITSVTFNSPNYMRALARLVSREKIFPQDKKEWFYGTTILVSSLVAGALMRVFAEEYSSSQNMGVALQIMTEIMFTSTGFFNSVFTSGSSIVGSGVGNAMKSMLTTPVGIMTIVYMMLGLAANTYSIIAMVAKIANVPVGVDGATEFSTSIDFLRGILPLAALLGIANTVYYNSYTYEDSEKGERDFWGSVRSLGRSAASLFYCDPHSPPHDGYHLLVNEDDNDNNDRLLSHGLSNV